MKKYIKKSLLLLTISMLSVSVFANTTYEKSLLLDESLNETETTNYYPLIVMNDSLTFSEKLFKGIGWSKTKVTSSADNSPPKISFYKKFSKEYSTTNEYKAVKIKVEGVSRKKHITLKVNGKKTRKFKFKKGRGLIKTKVQWKAGENWIEVAAKSDLGIAKKEMMVFYDTPKANPTVCITNPGSRISTTTEATKLVIAQLKNVTKAENINLLVNGLSQKFTYHAASGVLRATVDLEYGQNEIYIEGYNWKGRKATDKKIINRREEGTGIVNEPYGIAPTISVTAPYSTPFNTSNSTYVIKARIGEVTDNSQIEFLFNGIAYYNFSYNPNSGKFTAYVNLREGGNTFYIKATNPNGSNAKNGTIIYNNDTYAQRPQINVITPYNNQTITRNYVTFKADVYNITNKNQITLNVNGQRINNFSFNYGRNSIITNIDCFREGNNIIEIYATNAVGRTREQVVVYYRKKAAPTVRFISPTTNNGTVTLTKTSIDLSAIVTNANRNDIELRVNRRTYPYQLRGNNLTARFSLPTGRHNIQITARNQSGQTTQRMTVLIKNQILAPLVTIQRPIGRTTVSVNRYTVQAQIQNVKSLSDITVWVNNKPKRDFTFNPITGFLTLNTSLREGGNYIRIVAKNAGGTDAKSVSVTYQKPEEDKRIVDIDPDDG